MVAVLGAVAGAPGTRTAAGAVDSGASTPAVPVPTRVGAAPGAGAVGGGAAAPAVVGGSGSATR
ncbi:hypothetical protein [Nocardia brasiliensis]|uniref:hypothetical protein n=1 Tax=Nocardia brasiliensis TaxID=37326 RepID=UPI002457531E|nr:hypothetical protein [Nocardia brasiliensis]